jgi:Sir2 family
MRSTQNLWPEAPSILILTGAGISQESGLATFRDAGGIWANVRLEEVATPEAFARDPARVQAFYNARRRLLQLPSVIPNAAHEALANLEAVRPGEVLIATQNIDDLHERAGSRAVLHMHGELLKARCTACGNVTVWYDDLTGKEGAARSARSRASCARMSSGSARYHCASTRSIKCSPIASYSYRSARLAVSNRPRALSKRRAAPAPTQSNSILNARRAEVSSPRGSTARPVKSCQNLWRNC